MATVQLEARPERRLIRRGGGSRHLDLVVRASAPPSDDRRERMPLTVGLVLDRSGSMQGAKLETAKRATLATLDRLDERDQVAVVVFDDRIDVLQPVAPVSAALKWQVRTALSTVQARGSTALHQGWLTGCHAVATDGERPADGLARLLLLTDGLANVGETDPERIASEAAGVYAQTGVSTSTFGIGDDYNEHLLAPLAEAGGGHFHHLREAEDIARAFLGELGELLSVAAGRVCLDVEADPGVTLEMVSAYRAQPEPGRTRWSIALGDLLDGEERHVVVHCGFPPAWEQPEVAVRARVRWTVDGAAQEGAWQEARFAYASEDACDDEPRDPAVLHWVGLHHASRAQQEATALNARGDYEGARRRVEAVARRLSAYAGADAELHEALIDLRAFAADVSAPMAAPVAKEAVYQAMRKSRGERDYRGGPPRPPGR
jgi:Ca-activated chloride channel family protein